MLVAVVVAFCALAITYSRIDRRSEDNRHVAPHSLRRPRGSCVSGSRPRSRRSSSQCRLSVGGAPSVPIATMIRSQVSAPSVSPLWRIVSTTSRATAVASSPWCAINRWGRGGCRDRRRAFGDGCRYGGITHTHTAYRWPGSLTIGCVQRDDRRDQMIQTLMIGTTIERRMAKTSESARRPGRERRW
jgi:hypothetical protein